MHRADIWRYATIYHNGGIYSDSDASPLKHVDDWVTSWVQDKINDPDDLVDFMVAVEEMQPLSRCGEPFAPLQIEQWVAGMFRARTVEVLLFLRNCQWE